MATKRPQLAKLTRPRLHKAVTRGRLFAKLDDAREHKPAICVVGPPGAGKTTLVASWLDARSIKGIWYQVDPGDADLATFFYYLGEAARPFSRKGQRALPALTPEYLHDVEGFSRRFFRALFSRMPEKAVMVLDNYQEIDAAHVFHRLIVQAMEEVPAGMSIITISRRDPPDCYARLIANKGMEAVDWNHLRLTQDEAKSIAALHHSLPDDVMERLYVNTGGWTAGLVLALERTSDHPESGYVEHATRDATFDYFASQVFAKVPPETQQFLMCTAYLPHVSVSLAQELTGNRRAGIVLEDLFKRHLFVHKRPAGEQTYWYHSLFRSFLQSQSRQHFSDEDLDALRTGAARLLVEYGDVDAALKLFHEARNWEAIERLIIREAAALVEQGRFGIIADWIAVLPKERVQSSHWLLLWLGISRIVVGPVEARAHLERSFRVAAERGDQLCRAQAAAGVIQTYLLDYNHFRPLDAWAEQLRQAIAETSFENRLVEVRVQAALLTALSFRKPDHPALDPCAERVLELQNSISDPNLRLSAVLDVLAWGCLTGPVSMAERALPVVLSLWRLPEVTPLNAALAGYLVSWYHCMVGNREECRSALRFLEALAENEGLPVARAYAATIGAWLAMYGCDVNEAQRCSDILQGMIDARRPFDRGSSEGVKAWLSLLKREPHSAIEHGKAAVAAFDEVGSVLHQAAYRQSLVWGNILIGDFAAARTRIAEIRGFSSAFRLHWIEIIQRSAEAYIAIECGDRTEIEARLRNVFTFAREHDADYAFENNLRPWAARICAAALSAGIEPDYVRRIIKRLQLAVPDERLESWPWQVRIYAMGGFRVYVEGRPLVFGRKTPRKPLTLLKAIMAFEGRDATQTRLADTLWPDLDGDAAYHGLGINLHRLRRLLGGPETVLLSDGKVSLNNALVWTDIGFFESTLTGPAPHSDTAEGALKLYGGSFLADMGDVSWTIARRERVRALFVRFLVKLAQELEKAEKLETALSWYRRGVAAENLVEEFYQGVIRCNALDGRNTEALGAYRQLCISLDAELGTVPSDATRQLIRRFSIETGT